MEVLNWAAAHPFLSAFFVIIVCATIESVWHAFARRQTPHDAIRLLELFCPDCGRTVEVVR